MLAEILGIIGLILVTIIIYMSSRGSVERRTYDDPDLKAVKQKLAARRARKETQQQDHK